MRPLSFLFKFGKKTDEGHLKQMMGGGGGGGGGGLRNIFFIWP